MRRRLVLALAGAAVALGGLALTPRVLRPMAFFRVRQIELLGVRYVSPDDVLESLQLRPDQSVFDDLDVLEERASRVGGVVQARVKRVLPGTLRVEVSERIPIAFAPGPEGFVTLDALARPLPFDPTTSAVDLPIVARPDTLLVGALGAVRFASRDLYDEVDWVETVRGGGGGGGVRLVLGDRRILMPAVPAVSDVDAVLAVRELLARSGSEYEELDARYGGWVVVRRREP
ncbi:MAG: cell division protein FtsQ/DivIB [Gemmatimonadales bacterium]